MGVNSTKILVPAYWYPTGNSQDECVHQDYLRLAAGGRKVAAIVNPYNGPVSSDTTSPYYSLSFNNYHVCFQLLFTAGNEVFGYVKTKIASETSPGTWLQTGLRDITEIKEDINIWKENFNLTGIFLDEVSNLWQITEAASWGDHIAFYQSIFGYIRSVNPDWKIVINPGSAFSTEFIDASSPTNTADLAVVFEKSASYWDPASISGGQDTCIDLLWTQAKGTFGPGPWCPLVPEWDGADSLISLISEEKTDKDVAALMYGGEGVDIQSVVSQAMSWNVGYLYVTDRPKATPWDKLPTYWEELVMAV